MSAHTREELLAICGKQVKHWRNVRGLSLRQLSETTEIDHSNLGKLENGSAAISLIRLDRIAAALGVPLCYVVDPVPRLEIERLEQERDALQSQLDDIRARFRSAFESVGL